MNKWIFLFFVLFSFGFRSVSIICDTDGFCYQNEGVVLPTHSSVIQNHLIHSEPLHHHQKVDLYHHLGVSSEIHEEVPYVPFPWPCEETEGCAFVGDLGESLGEYQIPIHEGIPYVPFPWPGDQEAPYVPFPWPQDLVLPY